MTVDQGLYTVAEFEALADSPENADRLLELINGEIVEKMPTQEHGLIVANLITELNIFMRTANLIGRVTTETRHRLDDDEHNARIPDISVSLSREPLVKVGSVPRLPEIAVEVKSPRNSLRELRDKADYYIKNGVKLVWLVLPEYGLIEVYTVEDDAILTADDTLDGGDVLPGFSMAVSAVFHDPMADA